VTPKEKGVSGKVKAKAKYVAHTMKYSYSTG